jgi:hypothetical protein
MVELPTRGFSVLTMPSSDYIFQRLTVAPVAYYCTTMHNSAELIHAKLPQASFAKNVATNPSAH